MLKYRQRRNTHPKYLATRLNECVKNLSDDDFTIIRSWKGTDDFDTEYLDDRLRLWWDIGNTFYPTEVEGIWRDYDLESWHVPIKLVELYESTDIKGVTFSEMLAKFESFFVA